MKLGIIGAGTVGHAMARTFMEFAEVRVYDVLPERQTHDFKEVLETDLVFVALPTPQNKDGLGLDISFVEGFFRQIGESLSDRHFGLKNFVLKSTVPIGTTRRLAQQYNLPNLVHSPEFLTARCAVQDAMTPARNIVGYIPASLDCPRVRTEDPLVNLYKKRFPGVPIHVMTSDESEAVKIFQNSYFATKIAFFNEAHSLAAKLDLDWESIWEAMVADGRVGATHTQIPGPDGKYGFGGACLPKDLSQLIEHLEDANIIYTKPYEPSSLVSRAAYERNQQDRERTR